MELFFWTAMAIVGMYAFRYWLVRHHAERAIGYTHYLSVNHVQECAKAFITITNSDIHEEQKDVLRGHVYKALKQSDIYWKEYNKDYDYNKLWLAMDKWTVKQMFPHVTKMGSLVVIYE